MKRKIFRIAHLSDIHINWKYKRENTTKFIHILEKTLETDVDHVVITGDLIDNPGKQDFMLMRRIFSEYGLLSSKKLSLVIGNHDIYGGVYLAEDILDFPGRSRKTDFSIRVLQFRDYFPEVFNSTVTVDNDVFPYVKSLNSAVLFGINSIMPYSLIKNPFSTKGKQSIEDMRKLQELMSWELFNEKPRILLLHHHFDSRFFVRLERNPFLWKEIEWRSLKFKRSKHILSLLEKYSINYILHGHVHESLLYMFKNINVSGAGGSISGLYPDTLSANIIDIEDSRVTLRIKSYADTFTPSKIYAFPNSRLYDYGFIYNVTCPLKLQNHARKEFISLPKEK